MDASAAQELLRDVGIVVRASWAVSSSPPMHRYPEYVAAVRATPRSVENPLPAAMLAQLGREIGDAPHTAGPVHPLALPWSDHELPPRVRRVYAALISFVDDYPGAYPHELFPHHETRALIAAIAAAAPAVLDVPAQMRLALPIAGGRPFGAALLLHAATRTLARGRDGRVAPSLRLDLESRLAMGAAIAPFPVAIAGEGDPLGDTYHYWATFAAGLGAELAPGHVAPHALGAAFWLGPRLMETIRGGLFGRPLFCGSHGEIDRIGLAHGRALGRRA